MRPDDILALLDHLGIHTCKAVGISGGGNVLLHMATRQPERVKGTVLVSATPYFPAQARAIMRTYSNDLPEAQWEFLRRRYPGGDAQIKSILASTSAFADSYDDMNFTPPYLSTIQARTLIVIETPYTQLRSPLRWPKPFPSQASGLCLIAAMALSSAISGPNSWKPLPHFFANDAGEWTLSSE